MLLNFSHSSSQWYVLGLMLPNLSQSQPYVKNVLLVSAGCTLKTQCGDSEIRLYASLPNMASGMQSSAGVD